MNPKLQFCIRNELAEPHGIERLWLCKSKMPCEHKLTEITKNGLPVCLAETIRLMPKSRIPAERRM